MYLYGKCVCNYELQFFYDLIIVTRKPGSQAKVVTATITMLYLLSIAQLAIGWQLLQSSFLDSGETRETIFITAFYKPVWVIPALVVLSVACIGVTNILADGLLVSTTFTIPFGFGHLKFGKIWRCFYAWDRSLLAISLPSFFLVAQTGKISFENEELQLSKLIPSQRDIYKFYYILLCGQTNSIY